MCRRCINLIYGAKLTSKNCQYSILPQRCSNCKQMGNEVVGLTLMGRLKIHLAMKKARKLSSNQVNHCS